MHVMCSSGTLQHHWLVGEEQGSP